MSFATSIRKFNLFIPLNKWRYWILVLFSIWSKTFCICKIAAFCGVWALLKEGRLQRGGVLREERHTPIFQILTNWKIIWLAFLAWCALGPTGTLAVMICYYIYMFVLYIYMLNCKINSVNAQDQIFSNLEVYIFSSLVNLHYSNSAMNLVGNLIETPGVVRTDCIMNV